MNYLIIKSHPYSGSFNAGLAKAVKETAEIKGHSVSEIDLILDGFNPVMTGEDLKAWGQGQSIDPLVKKYQERVENTDILVFPFPVWWGAVPAVLKGFCEKVLLPGWAYKYDESGEMIGLLASKKAIVVTTMETPIEFFEDYYRNPIEGAFIKDTLQKCGIEVIRYFQVDKIVSGGRVYAESKMNEILGFIE